MTVTVANTANNNNFNYWLTRTNELAYAMSTKAVTVNSDAAVGNAQIIGKLTTNTISTTNISLVMVIANGAYGTNRQLLTSNGSGMYWTDSGIMDTTIPYTFTNTVVFVGNTSFAQTINGTANNTLHVGVVTAANVVSNAQLQANLSLLDGGIY